MHGTARAMAEEPDRTEGLAATGIPALVLHGRGDRRVWKRSAFAAMAARLGAEHVVIERAAHSPSLEQPERTTEALLSFWARHLPATGPRHLEGARQKPTTGSPPPTGGA
jgi:pimeloyl-ACP methyl ester carboxylesterase